MFARAPKDSIQGILHDLKMKTASFSRCYVEYGTYIDELESDKIRLNVAKAQGQDTKQLEGVMKETSDMLPITRQHAKKHHAGYVEFWQQRKNLIEKGIADAAPADRAKWQREVLSESQKLDKTMKRRHNPLSPEETAIIAQMLKDMAYLSEHAQLPPASQPTPSQPTPAPQTQSPAPHQPVAATPASEAPSQPRWSEQRPPPLVANPSTERAGTSGLMAETMAPTTSSDHSQAQQPTIPEEGGVSTSGDAAEDSPQEQKGVGLPPPLSPPISQDLSNASSQNQ